MNTPVKLNAVLQKEVSFMKQLFFILILSFLVGLSLQNSGCGNDSSTSPQATPTPSTGSYLGDNSIHTSHSISTSTLWFVPVQSNVTASFTKMSIYIYENTSGTGTTYYQLGIYQDNSNAPGDLLAETAPQTYTSTGWATTSLQSAASVTNGQKYWLAFHMAEESISQAGQVGSEWGIGTMIWQQSIGGTFTTFPSPASAAAYTNATISIYISN